MQTEGKKKQNRRIKNILLMTAASFCYGAGVSLFLDPNNLAPGGVTGISIILNRLFSISTGTLFLIINIPIQLLGMWKFGVKFILSTLYCTLLISFFTNLFAGVGAVTTDPLLAALAGAVLIAIGLGGAFKAGATTGGMDIIVKLIKLKYPYVKTGSLFLIADICVVIISGIVFRNINQAMYAGITVFITSFVLDLVLYGKDGAKLIYIISDKSANIAERLLDELSIGVTYMSGQGAYSGKEKKVIMCVMKKQSAPRAEEIVKEEDPESFMIVSSATEIFGEGYKSYFSEKL